MTALLRKQHAVITRDQVRTCGMTAHLVRYRTRAGGPWQVILPGVYLAHTGMPATVQREMAALLYAGPHSVLTGPAALRRHGLSRPGDDTVDVLAPATMHRADAGFARLHRTARLPTLFCVAGEIRFALPPRAVADAVRGLADLRDVRAIVAGAVQRGKCPLPRLADELRDGPVRDSAQLRRALAEVVAGIRSAAEGDLHDLIQQAGLPIPLFNPRLLVEGRFLAVPDCWWPDAGVAAEVDSRAWHLSPADWESTLARHARMSAHGIIVLHFTPDQLRTSRDRVATAIRGALNAGPTRAVAHITTLPAR